MAAVQTYLSRGHRCFFWVPASAVMRDHNVSNLAYAALPRWASVLPAEIIVLRGKSRKGDDVFEWCVRLSHPLFPYHLSVHGSSAPFVFFLVRVPRRAVEHLVTRMSASPAQRQSQLLQLYMAHRGKVDPEQSGWLREMSLEEQASLHPELHPEAQVFPKARWAVSWLHAQVCAALRTVVTIVPVHADGDALGPHDQAAVVSSHRCSEEQHQLLRSLLDHAHSLQSLLDEHTDEFSEGLYLKASNQLKVLAQTASLVSAR